MSRRRKARLKVEKGRMALHATPDGGSRCIPWIRFSTAPEPHLWITATVHGNEVTGIRALQKLYQYLRAEPFLGTVSIAPVLNPGGLARNQREVPETLEDLNRFFPGRPDGGSAERMANAIFQTIEKDRPDCHVDLHAESVSSVPYVILDRYLDVGAAQLRAEVEELSSSFQIPRLYDWPVEQYRANRLDSSLSGAMVNRARLPSFTVELGPSFQAPEPMADIAFRGLLGVLLRLGMLQDPRPELAPPVTMRRDTPLRAQRSGLVRCLVQPGQSVTEGDPLCELSDIFGEELQTLMSPVSGLVIALPDRYWFSEGVPLLTMAVPDQ